MNVAIFICSTNFASFLVDKEERMVKVHSFKTGTAQKVRPNEAYMQGNYILSFLGAAPMNDPKAVVYLAIENPKNTIKYGGVVTVAPI